MKFLSFILFALIIEINILCMLCMSKNSQLRSAVDKINNLLSDLKLEFRYNKDENKMPRFQDVTKKNEDKGYGWTCNACIDVVDTMRNQIPCAGMFILWHLEKTIHL